MRKTFTGAGLALATIIIPVSVVRDDGTAMAFLLAGLRLHRDVELQ